MLKKNVFITGANGGLGFETVKTFLKNGYNVICSMRKVDKKFEKKLSDLTKKNNQTIKILEFDLNDHEKVKNEIINLIKEKTIIDVLINNAGFADGSLFEMTSINKLKEVFETNFFSQIYITQLLLRLLKKSNCASIINIGSIMGIRAEKGTLSYGSSKAALMHATKIMANELSIYGIRTNAIAPNITKTNMLDKMDENAKEVLLSETYLNRPAKVEEICDLILFLASSKSSYINGQIYRIDGGMT